MIITMAGFGRRFLDAGYTVPKYRIEAHGRSLFAWSMLSLQSFIRDGSPFTFVVRAADEAEAFIESEAKKLGIERVSIVSLDAPTNGQATTALLSGPTLSSASTPIAIYNIDTFVHPDALPVSAIRGEGWIPCFRAMGDAWSFAAADASGRVSEVREKKRVSPHATVGLYYFSSFDQFESAYHERYADERNFEKGEAYVAPLYNTIIEKGADVFIHEVPVEAVIPLGVPDDVKAFLGRTPPAIA